MIIVTGNVHKFTSVFYNNRENLRQCVPVIFGTFLGVAFGMMLGWPSVTFPLLIDEKKAPILITLDQSSMIAGFLMEGNTFGTLFSSLSLLGTKPSILLASVLQIIGWIVMFGAQDIPGIGVSRFLVGFGSGFGLPQLKVYIQETCDSHIVPLFMRYLPLSVNFGVILMYIIGPFVSFRALSLVSTVVPIIALIMFGLIPKRCKKSQEKTAQNVTNSLGETVDLQTQVNEKVAAETKTDKTVGCLPAVWERVKAEADPTKNEQIGFVGAILDGNVRYKLMLMFVLVFIQQYSGGAANIVYAQIIQTHAGNPFPQFSPILYAWMFLFSTIIALKYADRLPRKPVLLTCCTMTSIILCFISLTYRFKPYLLQISDLFVWLPLGLLFVYNFFHTFGIATVPSIIAADTLPKYAKIVGAKCFVINFSLSAVISTKIFQMVFTRHGMYVSYAFVSVVAILGAVFILIFVKESRPKKADPENPVATTSADDSALTNEITRL